MLGYTTDKPLKIAGAASLINFNGKKFGMYFAKDSPEEYKNRKLKEI